MTGALFSIPVQKKNDRVRLDGAQRTGKECRCVVLGHLLRGGSPSAFDRVIDGDTVCTARDLGICLGRARGPIGLLV